MFAIESIYPPANRVPKDYTLVSSQLSRTTLKILAKKFFDLVQAGDLKNTFYQVSRQRHRETAPAVIRVSLPSSQLIKVLEGHDNEFTFSSINRPDIINTKVRTALDESNPKREVVVWLVIYDSLQGLTILHKSVSTIVVKPPISDDIRRRRMVVAGVRSALVSRGKTISPELQNGFAIYIARGSLAPLSIDKDAQALMSDEDSSDE